MKAEMVITQAASEDYGQFVDLSSLDGQEFVIPFEMWYSVNRIGLARCKVVGNDIHIEIDSPHSILRELAVPNSPYTLSAAYTKNRQTGEVKLMSISAIWKDPPAEPKV